MMRWKIINVHMIYIFIRLDIIISTTVHDDRLNLTITEDNTDVGRMYGSDVSRGALELYYSRIAYIILAIEY